MSHIRKSTKPLRRLSPLLLTLLLAAAAGPAVAIAEDKAGDTSWWRGFCPMGVDGPVTTATESGGYLYVGGTFTEAGGVEASCVARWTGSYWSRMISGGLNRAPTTLYDWGAGGLLAGGEFWLAGGDTARYAAQYRDGYWSAMGDTLRAEVYDFCMHDTYLYAAGLFPLNEWDPMTYYSAGARWNGVEWQLDNTDYWNGWDHDIYAMESFNTNLYFGGSFQYTNYNFPTTFPEASSIVRIDQDDIYHRLEDGIGGQVTDMVIANETLWLSGIFLSANGEACDGLAWISAGHTLSAADPVPINATIQDLIRYNDRPVAAMTGPADRRVMLYGPGGPWYDSYPGNFLQPLYCVASMDNDLYAGGSFYKGIAVWDADQWVHLGGGLGEPHDNSYKINALLACDDGLVAGGDFVLPGIVENLYSQNLAFWNGEHWHYMDVVFNFEVNALARHDGDLIVGGAFTTVNGDLRMRIIRNDGDTWLDMGGLGGTAYALLGDYNGSLIVGGSFTSAGGVGVQRIAAWNGSTWSGLGTGFNGTVRALALHDGRLYAGGDFTASGATPLSHIACWNPGTSAWEAVGSGTNGDVLSIVSFGGDLVIGGEFDQAGIGAAAHVARWNGSAWSPMHVGFGGDAALPAVKSLCVAEGRLLAGGNCSRSGSATVNYVAEWADDESWHPLGSGVSNGSYQTEVLAMTGWDGDLFLGGHFGTAGNYPSLNMARWDAGPLVSNFLKSFTAVRETEAVGLRWETTTPDPVGEFRLVERGSESGRSFPFAETSDPCVHTARVPFDDLEPGDMTFLLLHRDDLLLPWHELARATVQIPETTTRRLLGAAPNPFNAGTTIAFQLDAPSDVTLRIYTIGGRLVRELARGPLAAGRHEVPWDGRDRNGRHVASGSYVVKLELEDRIETAKIQLLK